jgi:hypothetical protein
MEKLNVDWDAAKAFLKDHMPTSKKLDRDLGFEYELVYHQLLRQKGLSWEFCQIHGIGYPKGKTMLAGCIAFTVSDEEGKRIAYYGIRIKDGKPVFHKSFNPELYLHGMNNVDITREVYFTTYIWKCLEIISKDGHALCNFGLPYLSFTHVELLEQCQTVLYVREDVNFKEIQKQATQMNNYFKFVA